MAQGPPGRPEPIRTDGSNAFAYHTIKTRMPENVHKVIAHNPDYPLLMQTALRELADTLAGHHKLPPPPVGAPDYDMWHAAWQARRAESWANTDWFFAENYLFRHILAAVRWWETGRDPYLPFKQAEYDSDAHWQILAAALEHTGNTEAQLTESFSRALWGNRIDLSYAAASVRGTVVGEDDLLVDESTDAVHQLLQGQGDVHVITDNAGTELSADMTLVDLLLNTFDDLRVALHVKQHPTFVSDATVPDVWRALAHFHAQGGIYAQLSVRLKAAFDAGRLIICTHPFWTSSSFGWDMPASLAQTYREARLVILKGDANYRRFTGDAEWPPDTPFDDVLGYFPAPLLALRTLKSDPIVGLHPGQAEALDAHGSDWRVGGQYGVIQYKA